VAFSLGWCYEPRLKGLPQVTIRGLHPLLSQMCCVCEMVRKLRARLEVASSNPHTAHAHISREKIA